MHKPLPFERLVLNFLRITYPLSYQTNMVLTSRTRTALFASTTKTSCVSRPDTLIRLPLSVVPKYEARCQVTGEIQRVKKPLQRTNLWSTDEHERFLQGLELFPNGPWREVAALVGTKTTRQTMTHAQKYRQKIERHMRANIPQPRKPRRRLKRESESVQHTLVPVKPANTKNEQATCHLGNESFANLLTNDTNVVSNDSTVSSPSEIWSDVFDCTFLDQEFDELISSLGSCPQWTKNSLVNTMYHGYQCKP